jgi:tetratricopeptide (TPR) repeat protein
MLPGQTLLSPSTTWGLVPGGQAVHLCPTDIRMAVARMVADNRLAEASVMSQTSLRQQPDNEELLVTRILVCEVLHQWQEAADCLKRLLNVQGREAPAETWYQYVRVLRCQGLLNEALEISQSALSWHPQHAGLQHEQRELMTLCQHEPTVSSM